MPRRPLLIFPSPQLADRTKRNGRQFGLVHKPNVIKQGARLSPLFAELQNAFDDRRVEIKQNAIGTDPEKVLVIEVVGGVENFSNAVKRINGLEWMGEFECGDIEPDEDFMTRKILKKANRTSISSDDQSPSHQGNVKSVATLPGRSWHEI